MSQENVEVVRALLDAWNRDDETALLACLVLDVVWIAARSDTEGAFYGHEGMRRFRLDTFENFEMFEPRFELRDLDQRVLAWGTIRVRGRGSGIEMDVPGGGVFELRDRKIVRFENHSGRNEVLQAVGLAE
jgi:ketosteroid isomerase-like protein